MGEKASNIVALTYGALSAAAKVLLVAFFLISPARGQSVTIAALGDSLTQGYGLAVEEGFVPQLTRWLQEAGYDAEVLNAGVSGDTTAGGLARVAWTLTPEVDAMIVALGGNDLLRGIAPEVSRANLEGILQKAQARDLPVLLIGLPAPLNYGAEYKRDFDAIYPELAETYGALIEPNFLAGLGDDLGTAQPLMQADGIHPNAQGVARIVAHLGPQVAALLGRVAE